MIETRDFDILSPEFHANPFPTLDRMRAEGPVVRMKLPIVGRTFLTVTHDSCSSLLKDHESFARDPGNAGSRTQERILRFLPRTIGLLALNMLGHDDPEHRRLRGLVDQAFQRRTIQAMKPMITEIADRLLDKLDGRTAGGTHGGVLPRPATFGHLRDARPAGAGSRSVQKLAGRVEGYCQCRRSHPRNSRRGQSCPLSSPRLATWRRSPA